MSMFSLDAKGFDQVTELIGKFADGRNAETTINQYLHGEGARKISDSIVAKLPTSGRTWKGKKAPAKTGDPFRQTASNLVVKIHTKGNYHYLYFPDDGSDTNRHYGNQRFMIIGAVEVQDEVADDIINKLLEKLEEL